MNCKKYLSPFFSLCIAAAFVFTSCNNKNTTGSAATTTGTKDTVKNDAQIIMGLLYQQRAAEYRALCFQCYNLAQLRLEQAIGNLKDYDRKKPFAIVTDLDETALDNSGNEAWLYKHDSAYNQPEFDAWSTFGKADSVPGSVSFFNYVNSIKDKMGRRITIYYISNRTNNIAIRDSTMSQMKALGFPQIVDSQFLFKGKDSASSKENRRLAVAESHKIILLLGDNLIDLCKAFDGTTSNAQGRTEKVDSLHDYWGKLFIVLPNAYYGDWEATLYPNGKYKSLDSEQIFRVNSLKEAHW